jgi:trehalose 6-phosphate phosphatase
MARPVPDAPDLPSDAALFLDFDGTLVEIAPTPDAIRVPPELPPLLARLAPRLGGALAIVTGRALADVERYLRLPLAVAAAHGASLRRRPGGPVEAAELPTAPAEWRERAHAFALRHPGALVEVKPHGFVVHFRQAPDAGEPARALLEAAIAEQPGEFTLLPARMAWEVRPRGASKATAVAALMAAPPFAGRVPVFVGDDVTDEEGMEAARERGGLGLRLQDAFGDPAGLRAWLARQEARLAADGP